MPPKKTTSSPFKLTAATYFSPQRPHVSVSMIKDYLRSPAHYHRKWVKREIDLPLTPSLKIGTVVDAILSGESVPFYAKVLAKDNKVAYDLQKAFPEDKLISQADMDKAKAMAQATKKLKFWAKPTRTRKLQLVLEATIGDLLVCGKPDVVEFDDTGIYIFDIKTAQPGASKNTWSWQRACEEWGYFHQLAMYRFLVKQNQESIVGHSEPLPYHFGHIVISAERDELIRVKLFKINEDDLRHPWHEIVKACAGISAKNFKDEEPTWEEAETVYVDRGSTATEVLAASETPNDPDDDTIWLEQ